MIASTFFCSSVMPGLMSTMTEALTWRRSRTNTLCFGMARCTRAARTCWMLSTVRASSTSRACWYLRVSMNSLTPKPSARAVAKAAKPSTLTGMLKR